jgi:hypothetical protein
MRPTSLLRLVIAFLLVIVLDRSASAQALPNTTRLLRFPTTNGQQIVFCHAGQLYTVAKEGGIARRLTSGPGYTSFPRFSGDGKQLAFTSQYDGNTEVYVMPGDGGAPKRMHTSNESSVSGGGFTDSCNCTSTCGCLRTNFEISGELCPLPMPEPLFLRTQLDLETGRCEVKARAAK